ncbi:MAG: cell division protein FtsA [Bacillota bacterium]|nr:cell division protein FtsA [Bacillota bacterium]
MPRRDLAVGVDVGTCKVAAIVGEVRRDGTCDIIGFGVTPSAGMRKGVVVDIEGVSRAIADAAQKAGRMAGVEIKSAYVSISGSHLSSLNNPGVVAVARDDREITAEDVDRVLDAARVLNVPADREIVHVVPREFVVDGYDGVKDPVGMLGVRLEVQAHVVTGAVTSIQNLLKGVARAGLQVEDLVVAALASGEAVLLPAERELGVLVLDIGGGTTDLCIFEHGNPWYSAVVPVGGEHITGDLAVGLRTPPTEAERIKLEHGRARPCPEAEDDVFEVPNVGGTGKRQMSGTLVAEIISPRLQELFALVRQQVARSGRAGQIPGGVVLCGGCALLPGIAEMAEEELGMPVRIGNPSGLGGLADMVSSPAFATTVGLLIYATRRGPGLLRAEARGGVLVSLWDRLRRALGDFF